MVIQNKNEHWGLVHFIKDCIFQNNSVHISANIPHHAVFAILYWLAFPCWLQTGVLYYFMFIYCFAICTQQNQLELSLKVINTPHNTNLSVSKGIWVTIAVNPSTKVHTSTISGTSRVPTKMTKQNSLTFHWLNSIFPDQILRQCNSLYRSGHQAASGKKYRNKCRDF